MTVTDNKTLVGVLIFLAAMLAALFLSSTSCTPQPKPGQNECWPKAKLGCATCVASYCGWCEGVGCFSFSSETICAEPIGFIQSCTDGTAPFPDSVVNPIPYGRSRRDGGADLKDGVDR